MSNKVCLILPCNLYVIPYFRVYENIFSEIGCSYDILTWNRSMIQEKCNGTIYSYDKADVANNKDPKKVFKYLGFYRFVKKHLKNHNYEKVVFLDTSACTVVLLGSYMRRYFYKKYWVDIRDYSFERFKLYKWLLKRALDYSYACDISSKGFLSFLPSLKNYCVTHNIDFDTIQKIKDLPKSESDKIRISFIGNVRYLDINKNLLRMFKNDNRFQLQFYGVGSEVLETFCKEENINNVDFYGRFPFEKTGEFYQRTDVINNIYGNDTMEVTTALSNKLYYSMYLEKPILVSPGTYMESVTERFNLGMTVDFSDKYFPEKLFNWYNSYFDKGNESRLEAIKEVEGEFSDYKTKFIDFIRQ